MLSKSTTSEQVEKVGKFIEEHDLHSNKNLRTALNDAKFNFEWSKHNVPIIKNYLYKGPNGATSNTVSHLIVLGMLFITFIIY